MHLDSEQAPSAGSADKAGSKPAGPTRCIGYHWDLRVHPVNIKISQALYKEVRGQREQESKVTVGRVAGEMA